MAGGSRKPSTSWGVVDGSSLHFWATCHFLRMTRCRSLRKSLGGSASFFGLDSLVLSERFGGGGFLGRAGASWGTKLKVIFLLGFGGGSWKLTALRCACGEECLACSSVI